MIIREFCSLRSSLMSNITLLYTNNKMVEWINFVLQPTRNFMFVPLLCDYDRTRWARSLISFYTLWHSSSRLPLRTISNFQGINFLSNAVHSISASIRKYTSSDSVSELDIHLNKFRQSHGICMYCGHTHTHTN